MQIIQISFQRHLLIAVFIIGAALVACPVMAQQTAAKVKAVKTEKPKRSVKAVSARAPTLSKELQKSLEAGDTRQAIELCGSACQRSPSTTLSAGSTGGTRDYTCNGGNCACAGAADCVAMAPICQEDTIGCNDYGCTCKEGDSGDG
ncbi:MAG: hypothetical protein OQJ84_04965 [Xanthomonadales bacterium]|nr:hypothetical protein [Xanthomonadales bacterium]